MGEEMDIIQRCERHKRRRSPAVILIVGVVAIIMGCSRRSRGIAGQIGIFQGKLAP